MFNTYEPTIPLTTGVSPCKLSGRASDWYTERSRVRVPSMSQDVFVVFQRLRHVQRLYLFKAAVLFRKRTNSA